MIQNKVNIVFVYPNGDEVLRTVELTGMMLSEVDPELGMTPKNKTTCIVNILEGELPEPNEYEKMHLTEDKLARGFRYAHTFEVKSNLKVGLNLVRMKFVNRRGEVSTLIAAENESLYSLHRRERMDMAFACGGQLSCSTCFCEVLCMPTDPAEVVGEKGDDEEYMISTLSVTPNSRLGCQCRPKLVADNKLAIINGGFKGKKDMSLEAIYKTDSNG